MTKRTGIFGTVGETWIFVGGVRQLHLRVFNGTQIQPTFLISDIRTLWRSDLSAEMS